jgi:hypothetical protein
MVETLMSTWNDDRLDELSQRMDAGFARVDQEMKEGFARVDQDMKDGFARVDKAMGELRVEMRQLNARFDGLHQRFDRLFQVLLIGALGFAGTVTAAIVGHLVFNI